MLTEKQQIKWSEYQQAEKDRIQSVLRSKLDDFILSLSEAENAEYEEWVYRLCAEIIDHESEFPIRMPLFERVIFPTLYRGMQNSVPGCARWLAELHQLIIKSCNAKSILGDRYTKIALLHVAVEHDPSDLRSHKMLIDALASQLEYAVHEAPFIVLCDNQGATIEKCQELQNVLAIFKRHIDIANMQENYKELVEECEFHFAEYAAYLKQKDSYASYEEYLQARE